MNEQETAQFARLEKSSSEVLSLLDQHLRREVAELKGPPWYRKLERWVQYTLAACGAVIFITQGLHCVGAIELSPDLSPLLKWPLLAIVLLAVLVAWIYFFLVCFLAMWQVASKQFRLFVGERCRADAMLIAKLARFDEVALFPLARSAGLRESLFEGRERSILGFLDKVPILAVMLISALAVRVEAVKVPAELGWMDQLVPTPLNGVWVAILGGLFTVLRMHMYYGRERVRAYAAYVNAALEYKKTLLSGGATTEQDSLTNGAKQEARRRRLTSDETSGTTDAHRDAKDRGAV